MRGTTRTRARADRRRRLGVVLLPATALVLLAWLLLRPDVPGTPPPGTDAAVTLTEVSYPAGDTAYTLTSVEAVTRGEDGFLRLRLYWADEPEVVNGPRTVPAFSAEVRHDEPYAGLTATCGLPGPTTVEVDQGRATVELRCSGLLVPADVAAVSLSD